MTYCIWRMDMRNLEYLWIFLLTLDMWLFQFLFFACYIFSLGMLVCFKIWFLSLLTTWHVWRFPPVSLDQLFFLLLGNLRTPHLSQWASKTEYEHRISSNNLSTFKTPSSQKTTNSGSTTSTLLHDKINPKDCQVLSLGDSGFLQFF